MKAPITTKLHAKIDNLIIENQILHEENAALKHRRKSCIEQDEKFRKALFYAWLGIFIASGLSLYSLYHQVFF